MTTETLKCEPHGETTRLTCVDCERPICPKCFVRTQVGLKCGDCAKPAVETPAARSGIRARLPLLVGVAGLLLVVVAGALLWRSDGEATAPVVADPVGAWEARGDLSGIRGTTSAVVLDDGTVLVAGGGVSAIALENVERYDPDAGQWRSAAALEQPRRGHEAVLLPDGQVLVAGGFADGSPLEGVERYDPDADAWTTVAPMGTARLGHSLTLLDDGRVLAAGGAAPGAGGQVRPTDTAEIYDPAADAWEPVSSLGLARFEHTATLLPDGRVLLAGGMTDVDGTLEPVGSAELFDPAAGGFVSTNDLEDPRVNHRAVRLSDGAVLVIGGTGGPRGDTSLASVERFDPRRAEWSDAPPLSRARSAPSATALADGRVLVAGGELVQAGSRRSLTSAEVFAPGEDAWLPAGDMACPRSEHAAVLLGDGRVLALAGDAAFPGQAPSAQSCIDEYQP